VTPRGILAFCREKEVKAVDIRYADLLGCWQHITIPVERLSEASFEQGFGILAAGRLQGENRERLLIPQATSAFLDPFCSIPTLILIGTLQDPITREEDPFDSRAIAERAVAYLQSSGLADRVLVGARCEFFLFDRFGFESSDHRGSWAAQTVPCGLSNLDFRNGLLEQLRELEVPAVQHDAAVEPRGSQAVVLDHQELVSAADAVLAVKHFAKRVAQQRQQIVSFLPQPIAGGKGAGLELTWSLLRSEEPLFSGQAYGGLSDLAIRALGGIRHHLPALTALCNPTTNGYKRLHPAAGPGWLCGYTQTHPRSVCRVSMLQQDPRTKAFTFCTPEATSNPYLCMAAILMAIIDGMQNKLEPGTPDVSWDPAANGHSKLPLSLWEALDELDADRDFLTRGDVFSHEVLDAWLDYKRHVERPAIESHPTPAEFQEYGHW
jgi:glutamine synthetase